MGYDRVFGLSAVESFKKRKHDIIFFMGDHLDHLVKNELRAAGVEAGKQFQTIPKYR
jgi:hypothetical protein